MHRSTMKIGMRKCICSFFLLFLGSLTWSSVVNAAPAGAVATAAASDGAKTSPMVMSGTAGEWGYRCLFPPTNPAAGPQFCLMQQSLMMEGESGKAEALGAVILARATENTVSTPLSSRPWRMTVVVPLAFSLLTQPRLALDGNSPITLRWQSCVSTGCMASLDLTTAQVAEFRAGKNGHIMVDKVVGGTLTINFVMDGAVAALDQLESWIHQSPFRR